MMKYVKSTFEKQICKNMIELYNEDCLTQMLNLHKQSMKVDHIICDLPYFQVVKNDFDNQWKSIAEYTEWLNKCFEVMNWLLKEGGNIILFCSRQNMWRVGMLLDAYNFEENRTIIWARKRGFNNTRGKALASGYEPILFWSKGKSNTFNNIKLKVESNRPEYKTGSLKDGITMPDVWTDIPALPHNSKEKVNHPTQKPIKLMERIVSLFTNEGDTVLDFCMGSGSTGVACLNLNRNFIGIEKDLKYFNIAKSRVNYDEMD